MDERRQCTQIIWQHALRPIGLGQNTLMIQKVLVQPHWQFYTMSHFVDSFTGEAAFLEGRIARPRRHSLAMATFFMVQRRQAFNS